MPLVLPHRYYLASAVTGAAMFCCRHVQGAGACGQCVRHAWHDAVKTGDTSVPHHGVLVCRIHATAKLDMTRPGGVTGPRLIIHDTWLKPDDGEKCNAQCQVSGRRRNWKTWITAAMNTWCQVVFAVSLPTVEALLTTISPRDITARLGTHHIVFTIVLIHVHCWNICRLPLLPKTSSQILIPHFSATPRESRRLRADLRC